MSLCRCRSHCCHVHIPAIDLVTLRYVRYKSRILRSSIHHLHLGKAYPLFVSRSCGDTRNHHELYQLLGLGRQFTTLGVFKSIIGGGNVLVRERFEKLVTGQLPYRRLEWLKLTVCSLSCQNSFSRALSRNGKLRTWLTKMKRRRGSSESSGATSPASDLKGAPNRCKAVGLESSDISHSVC